MGLELQAARPDLFERFLGAAEAESGLPLRRLACEGTIEELTTTDVAQPAIFAVSAAVADMAREAGVVADRAAGHSLGEYTAAVAAGALDFATGLRLVSLRGRLMARAQSERPGGMAAIGGLDRAAVERVCQDASAAGTLVVANYNSPYQHVLSGEVAAVERSLELATAAGAEQALRLNVGAAFHSPLMAPVAEEMAVALAEVEVRDPAVPLAVNWNGQLVRDGAGLREALLRQVTSPVRWIECMRSLIALGPAAYLELGPGRVLTGQARLIDHDLEAFAADGPKKLAGFVTIRSAAVQ